MFNLGSTEIVIILVVALLVLGPQQLPEVGKFIGKALRDIRGMSGEVTRALDLDGHNDYDRAPNRGSSFEYGYADKTDYGVEHDEDGTKAFAYSAPVAGTTVAAIDSMPADHAPREPIAHVGDEPEAHTTPVAATTTGARTYNTPATTATETVTVAPAS